MCFVLSPRDPRPGHQVTATDLQRASGSGNKQHVGDILIAEKMGTLGFGYVYVC